MALWLGAGHREEESLVTAAEILKEVLGLRGLTSGLK